MARKFGTSVEDIQLRAANEKIRVMELRNQQLEEQYKNKEAHMNEIVKKLRHVEDCARDLCQDILSKDRDEMRLGGVYTWRQVETEELIRKASASYKKYCISRYEALLQIKSVATEKISQLDDASEENDRLREKISSLQRKLSSGSVKSPEELRTAVTAEVQQTLNGLEEKFSRSGVRVIVEDQDAGSVAPIMEKAARMAENAKVQADLGKASKAAMPKAVQEVVEKAAAEEREKPDAQIQEITDRLNENEQRIVRLLGSKGVSVRSEMISLFVAKNMMTRSAAVNAFSNLEKMNIIAAAQLKVPTMVNALVVKLTAMGMKVYTAISGKQPVEAECDRIKREHTDLEHGYGIREVYLRLRDTHMFDDLSMFQRGKQQKLANGERYAPDILGVIHKEDGKKETYYFEYEIGTHTPGDFDAKLNKMAILMNDFYIIVPAKLRMKSVQEKVYKWCMGHANDPGINRITIHMTNLNAIADFAKSGRPFSEWWLLEKPANNFPSVDVTGTVR